MSDRYILLKDDVYRRPSFVNFSREHHPEIHEAELALHESLHRVARLISEPLGFNRTQRYTHSLPEALASLLARVDADAGIVAAVAYLESRGYEISKGGNHE
jgi:hypothetical protein